MSQEPRADVVVQADGDPTQIEKCLQGVLLYSGQTLRTLVVVKGLPASPIVSAVLERLEQTDPRIHIVDHGPAAANVGSLNRGLAERAGDAVILEPDCVVGPGWLAGLGAVAYSEPRTACAIPLTSGIGRRTSTAAATVEAATSGLPAWTIVTSVAGSCAYLRGDVIDAVGLLDTRCASLESALRDWVTRASYLGFGVKRANRVFVQYSHSGEATTGVPASESDEQSELLHRSLDDHLASHAVRVEATGKLRVALDLRHLPREQVGTRTYAVGLGQGLAKIGEIDLTLLVREPAQAGDLEGRVVTAEDWNDDVEVIHKPAQVVVPAELKLLFESSAHVVITYQDLIGFRIPSVFPTDYQHERYVGTTSLSLPAVQRVIAYSQSAADEITAAFGIPDAEIAVIPLGADAGWFALVIPTMARPCASLARPRAISSASPPIFRTRTCPTFWTPTRSCAGGGGEVNHPAWCSPVTRRVHERIFIRHSSQARCPTA